MEYKHKRRLIIGVVIFLIIALFFAREIFKNDFFLFFMVSLSIFCFVGFYLIDHLFKLEFELKHYLYFGVMVFAGVIFAPLEFISKTYDKLLHFVSPIFLSILLFFLINKLKIKFSLKLLLTFSLLVTIITFFEFAEYFADVLWDMGNQGVWKGDLYSMQRLKLILSRNDDTMIDLLLGAAGSLVFVASKTIGHFYKKRQRKSKKQK